MIPMARQAADLTDGASSCKAAVVYKIFRDIRKKKDDKQSLSTTT